MENEKGFLFFILGPNSSGKTKTAIDVASWLESKTTKSACQFSRGSVFRAASSDLMRLGIHPDDINPDTLSSVLENFSYRRDGSFDIRLFDQHGNGRAHSLNNGITATNYAANPIFQNAVLKYAEVIISELRYTFKYVVVEGRNSSPDADGFVWLTGDHKTVRTQIKRSEYPEETQGKSDEDIAKEILTRDSKDFRKPEYPLRVPNGPVIRRLTPDTVGENQDKIVNWIGSYFLNISNQPKIPLSKKVLLDF